MHRTTMCCNSLKYQSWNESQYQLPWLYSSSFCYNYWRIGFLQTCLVICNDKPSYVSDQAQLIRITSWEWVYHSWTVSKNLFEDSQRSSPSSGKRGDIRFHSHYLRWPQKLSKLDESTSSLHRDLLINKIKRVALLSDFFNGWLSFDPSSW